MSLIDDKRVHIRKVVENKEKCKLIISDTALNQINFMHETVRKGIEWSAILIYDTLEGSIEDPKNWAIKVDQIVPMDVGTSGYTEYEFTPEDPLVDRWMDALAEGKKIGHIHSHHNMTCFFSGTDTSELHDNSPKHNYYLSLIVNYKDHTAWCAKVASIGSQTMQGTVEVSTTKRGVNGEETVSSVEDMNSTEHYMYTMDCDIQLDRPATVDEVFSERVIELNKPKFVYTPYVKKDGYTPGYQSYGVGKLTREEQEYQTNLFPEEERSHLNARIGGTGLGVGMIGLNDSLDTDFLSEMNTATRKVTQQDEITMMDVFGIHGRESEMYSAAKVKPFLCKLLTQGASDNADIYELFTNLQKTPMKDLLDLQDWVEDNFEKALKEYFNRNSKDAIQRMIDCHAVSISILDIIKVLDKFHFHGMLEMTLEGYILDNQTIELDITSRLTGLDHGEIFKLM